MTLNAKFVSLAEDCILLEKVEEFPGSIKSLYAYTVIENDGLSFET
jgi:hypothetical protein